MFCFILIFPIDSNRDKIIMFYHVLFIPLVSYRCSFFSYWFQQGWHKQFEIILHGIEIMLSAIWDRFRASIENFFENVQSSKLADPAWLFGVAEWWGVERSEDVEAEQWKDGAGDSESWVNWLHLKVINYSVWLLRIAFSVYVFYDYELSLFLYLLITMILTMFVLLIYFIFSLFSFTFWLILAVFLIYYWHLLLS